MYQAICRVFFPAYVYAHRVLIHLHLGRPSRQGFQTRDFNPLNFLRKFITLCDFSACFMAKNNLKKIRENMLLSKSELARKAGISPLTVDRIERGHSCRVDTKRKIIQALGFKLSERNKVFLNDEV